MVQRSRTGCLTCRVRKLKCSEERPVCAQCAKAQRICKPSSGVTFRHQQNPSMNAVKQGSGNLKNFYGYRETFGKDTTWVEVPKELKFVHTSNPFEDGEDAQYAAEGDTSFMTDASVGYVEAGSSHDDYQLARQLAQAAYPAYATHGLEALSAVASQDQYSYAPPPAPMSQQEQMQTERLPTRGPQDDSAAEAKNLHYALNPSSASNIDPRLHSETTMAPAVPDSEQNETTGQTPATTSIEEQLLRAQS